MKHFENNILDGQSTVDAINDLNELSGAVSVNALSRFPEGMRREGYELVNKNVDRELVEKARRDEAERAAKRVVSIIFCPKED